MSILISRRGSMAGSGPVFNPFAPISWHVAAWAGDPAWTNPGDGNAVSSWRDGSGNSRTLTQATGANQPIFRASVAALNGRSGIQFDGSNDFLSTATFTAINVPWSFVCVAKIDTITDNKYLLGASGAGGAGLSMSTISTNHYRLFNSAPQMISTLTADTSNHFLHAVANGASSKIGRDGTQQTGTTGNGSQTGFFVGSFDGTQAFAAVQVAFAAVYNGDVTADGGWTTFKTNVAAYYGLTIV